IKVKTSLLLRRGLRLGGGQSENTGQQITEGKLGGDGGEVDLSMAGGTVIVQFRSTPEGASVLLDDSLDPLCETPCSKKVGLGPHKFTMTKSRYRSASSSIDVSKANNQVTLPLQAKFARLSVSTTPSGLTVSYGDKKATTPVNLVEVDPGPYRVVVED